jgi:glycosylphosphatidylinositol transamidase (GPIT) subunit GPI8
MSHVVCLVSLCNCAGRYAPDTPHSKRLLTDANSNILIYMTGHGGDEFLKFQDSEEISSRTSRAKTNLSCAVAVHTTFVLGFL